MVLIDITEGIVKSAYNIVAVVIFACVSYTFLFPCNAIIPLDRRTIAVVGALACYLSRIFLFPSNRMDVLEAIDFDVLILLASIMVINHIVVHLKETKNLIHYFQSLVQKDPIRGFWAISFAAFIISPFLTNDGVCLLFVEPIIHAFEDTLNPSQSKINLSEQHNNTMIENEDGVNPASHSLTIDVNAYKSKLEREDALYFLVALACSANIGSALTYTGNPQNMIVASDSIDVMPPYKFLLYMIVPTLLCWFITIKWIERSWLQSKEEIMLAKLLAKATFTEEDNDNDNINDNMNMEDLELAALNTNNNNPSSKKKNTTTTTTTNNNSSSKLLICWQGDAPSNNGNTNGNGNSSPLKTGKSARSTTAAVNSMSSPLSPRRQRARERDRLVKRVVKVVSSPIPYIILVLLFIMIVMIFVDILPISSLICVVAMTMVLVVVLGNHWQNALIWEEDVHDPLQQSTATVMVNRRGSRRSTRGFSMDSVNPPVYNPTTNATTTGVHDLGPITYEDKIDNLNEFFEDLFQSIDYSLLLIFLGTFIVVENMASTGIPRAIWKLIVGPQPFQTILSIAGISAFILIASQLLGNVAVIQLAKPNVHDLDDDAKRLAWAVISFVATIGGNLTITGSAANIIVAEKANRLDPTIALNFYRHYQLCFWITLLCCVIGGSLLSAIVAIDNMILN